MGPVKLFSLTHSNVKSVSPNREVGSDEVKWLPSAQKYCNLLIPPICDGSDPVKWLYAMPRYNRFDKPPIVVGNDNVREFNARSRNCNLLRPPNELGKGPVKLLEDMYRYSRLFPKKPRDEGIVQGPKYLPMLETSSVCKLTRLPSSEGKLP